MKLEAESYLKSGSNEVQVLEYKLGGMSFGINILKVRRIVNETPCLTDVPNSPPNVEGVFRDRDEVVPVIDLASFLGMQAIAATGHKKAIITEFFGRTHSFFVDSIDWIHHFYWKDVIDAEEVLAGFDHRYVIGIVKPSEDHMIQLLDYETIILALTATLQTEEWSEGGSG